jgi:hypothetical protein
MSSRNKLTAPSSQRTTFKPFHRKNYTEHIGIATEPTDQKLTGGEVAYQPEHKGI